MRYRKVHFFVICIAPFTILREEVALWCMAPPPSAPAAAGENTPAAHRQTIGNDGTQNQRLKCLWRNARSVTGLFASEVFAKKGSLL